MSNQDFPHTRPYLCGETQVEPYQNELLGKYDDYNRTVGTTAHLQGQLYHTGWAILILFRAAKDKYDFLCRFNWDAAGKFDDIVLNYIKNGKSVFSFLQIKHTSSKKEFFMKDFIENNDFNIAKYFESYRQIKIKPEFRSGTLKDFTICCNYIPNFTDKEWKSFELIKDPNDIIQVSYGSSKVLKFKRQFEGEEAIIKIIKERSELLRLAKGLARAILGNENLEDPVLKKEKEKHLLFSRYYDRLGGFVINFQKKNFRPDFLDINVNLPEDVENFRNIFLHEYVKERQKDSKMLSLYTHSDALKEIQMMHLKLKVDNILRKRKDEFEITSLPNDLITDEQVREFFNVFMFAVNQPDRYELEKITRNEMSERFHNRIDDRYNSMYTNLSKNMAETRSKPIHISVIRDYLNVDPHDIRSETSSSMNRHV